MRLVLIGLIVVSACRGDRSRAKIEESPGSGSSVAKAASGPRRDPHSLSRPDQLVVNHLALDLVVDFQTKVLTGKAALSLTRRDPKATTVVLDTEGLAVDAVTDCVSAKPIPFALAPEVKRLGQALTVTPASDCIAIAY